MAIISNDMAMLTEPRTSATSVINMEYDICMRTATREMINTGMARAFRIKSKTPPRIPSKTAIAKTIFIHKGLVSYNALSGSGKTANASAVMKTSIKKEATPDRFHKIAMMLIDQNPVVGFVRLVIVI